ncbi:galactose-3-O-sulfotransferase 3-like [Strongylocentrotus purpuratus]|uniref:Galactosylceramide sulfotransferase-like n=1 Tax=Strongylocentrotus purpuratus TaxID=7668 RepID=A0A7M7NJD0_STRPU|nr:galactose-3-O-sulfotransferase 3-like [Strongylocentrotus purpuratus]
MASVPSRGPTEPTCFPHHKVVYLKTHKTGSTTVGSIFNRYAFTRNLTVLVPLLGHFVNCRTLFNTKQITEGGGNHSKKENWSFKTGYDMLTNHARLDKKEMDKAFHNARYVTILREPAAQWQSAFNYFEVWKSMPQSEAPMDLFLSQPKKYFAHVMSKSQYFKVSMHNEQLYDFGLEHNDTDDEEKVMNKIRELESVVDLVMITEYFDESLLLLRKLLCWRMEDVVYLKHGVRSADYRNKNNDSLADKIREWNKADLMLYNHFNETFWRKVLEYGPSFSQDLANLKNMLSDTFDTCLNKTRVLKTDRRAETFAKNKNSVIDDQ